MQKLDIELTVAIVALSEVLYLQDELNCLQVTHVSTDRLALIYTAPYTSDVIKCAIKVNLPSYSLYV